uniref:PDZ domain-containing protein n=1 Tax=Macrostomum lignano TaxID=282301 RepID=A0A1I8FKW3_9PLAT
MTTTPVQSAALATGRRKFSNCDKNGLSKREKKTERAMEAEQKKATARQRRRVQKSATTESVRGDALSRDIPYKALLLTLDDTWRRYRVRDVRKVLTCYCVSADYCLIKIWLPAREDRQILIGQTSIEEPLPPDERSLRISSGTLPHRQRPGQPPSLGLSPSGPSSAVWINNQRVSPRQLGPPCVSGVSVRFGRDLLLKIHRPAGREEVYAAAATAAANTACCCPQPLQLALSTTCRAASSSSLSTTLASLKEAVFRALPASPFPPGSAYALYLTERAVFRASAFNMLLADLQDRLQADTPALLAPESQEDMAPYGGPEDEPVELQSTPPNNPTASLLQLLRCLSGAMPLTPAFSISWCRLRQPGKPASGYYLTASWGDLLLRRLERVKAWAERQGLELAAECHLASGQAVADPLHEEEGLAIELLEEPDLKSATVSCPTMVHAAMLHWGCRTAWEEFLTPLARQGLCQLAKYNNSLGLSIVSATALAGPDQGVVGTYVKAVIPGGAADRDGRIETGDQLLGSHQPHQRQPPRVITPMDAPKVVIKQGRRGSANDNNSRSSLSGSQSSLTLRSSLLLGFVAKPAQAVLDSPAAPSSPEPLPAALAGHLYEPAAARPSLLKTAPCFFGQRHPPPPPSGLQQ